MANSLGTVATDLIAQEALSLLTQNLQFLNNVHTDFSQENLAKGSNVTTHILTDVSAGDFSSSYSASDVTQSDVDITLDKHKHVTFALSDSERDSSQVNLVPRFAESAAHAIGKSVVDTLTDKMTGATGGLTLGSSGLDMDAIIDLGAEMDADGVPEVGRWIVANPSVLADLEKDIVGITNATYNVSGTILNGGVTRVRGFDIFSYGNSDISATSGEAGAYAGFRDSLCMVTSAPSLPPEASGASLSYVTEPNSGLTVQRREWYDASAAKYYFTLTLYFGVQAPAEARLYKITNA